MVYDRNTGHRLFAILQKYDFSSKSQHICTRTIILLVVCDTAKVRFFKQITTGNDKLWHRVRCLRYCKSTIFQANHNLSFCLLFSLWLFAILQKYDFSSKSQLGMLLILIEVVLTFNGSITWVEFIFFVW